MNRREFLGAASAAVLAPRLRAAQDGGSAPALKPMTLGLLIAPFGALEERIKRVRDLGFSNCFLSLDGYIGQFTPALAAQFANCWTSMS
jgi:L-ribulose-5-phosphate 3-epimerase